MSKAGTYCFDCPNQRIITLVKEENYGGDVVDAEILSDKDKEVIYAYQQGSLILPKVLSKF